jgi:maternal-effect protein exuperantia
MSSTDAKSDLPMGKYTLVSIDVDTTGRRLIDEIVQLSAYTPKSEFAEYIMPIMNLNPAARQRHQIRVITVGFFRMLKSMQTYRVVKTKTEIAVLKDFLDWLEQLRKDDPASKGIILIHHEQRKFVPYMLLEALQKYDLVPRFMESVKSFADGFALSLEKCGIPAKYFSIIQTAEIYKLVDTSSKDKEEFDGCARIRAKLAYQIVEHIAKGDDGASVDDETAAKKMNELVVKRASPIQSHFNALDDQNKCMERQNSMRPIFVNYFKVTLYHRVRGVTFRRVLADHGYDLEKLKNVWEEKKKEGFVEIVSSINDLKEDDQTELIDILEHHFDPEKKSILPVIKRNRSKRRQSVNQKENVKPRNNQNNQNNQNNHNNDNGKKGGNDAPNNNRNNRNANRRNRNRSNRRRSVNKGDDMRYRNGDRNGVQGGPPAAVAH